MRISLRYRPDRQETIVVFIDRRAQNEKVWVTSWTKKDREPVSGWADAKSLQLVSRSVKLLHYPGGGRALAQDVEGLTWPLQNRRDWKVDTDAEPREQDLEKMCGKMKGRK